MAAPQSFVADEIDLIRVRAGINRRNSVVGLALPIDDNKGIQT